MLIIIDKDYNITQAEVLSGRLYTRARRGG